jgi:hypothetical protein
MERLCIYRVGQLNAPVCMRTHTHRVGRERSTSLAVVHMTWLGADVLFLKEKTE